MGRSNVYPQPGGLGPCRLQWREPWLFPIRLRRDLLWRCLIVVAAMAAATGLFMILFTVLTNSYAVYRSTLFGVLSGSFSIPLLFFQRSQRGGRVWFYDDHIRVRRLFADFSGPFRHTYQWSYASIAHCVLLSNRQVGSRFHVLVAVFAGRNETVGVPLRVDLQELVQFLNSRGVSVRSAHQLPDHVRSGVHPAIAILCGCLAVPIFVMGLMVNSPLRGLRDAQQQQTARVQPRFVRPETPGIPPLKGIRERMTISPPRNPAPPRGEPKTSKSSEDAANIPSLPLPLTPENLGIPNTPGGFPGRGVGRAGPFGRGVGVVPDRRQRDPSPLPTAPNFTRPLGPKLEVTYSELIGGNGRSPNHVVNTNNIPAIGLRYLMGEEAGKPGVARLTPVFKRDAEPGALDAMSEVLWAKDGYALGGLKVSVEGHVSGIQFLFMKQTTEGSLDSADNYVSDWIGSPTGPTTQQIVSDGRPVIGLQYRSDVVINTIGLVFADAESADRGARTKGETRGGGSPAVGQD